jgi:pimeloyl-ACP methyl ester carboxylesterase
VKREFGDVTPGKGFMWDEKNCPLSESYVNDLKTIDHLLDDAAKVSCPWLLIHGTEDDVVPIEDSRKAFEVARCDKKLIEIPGAGHSFDTETYSVLVDRIDFWLKKCFG